MKTIHTRSWLLLSFLTILAFSCKKENTLEENQKNIKKLWKLDQYLLNSVDRTSSLSITNYTESYADNSKYDRSYTDKNGNKETQNGAFEFENANRLHVSGVGSIEFINGNTASSSYYDILKLNESEFWYSYTNGSNKHEYRLSRK